LAASATLGTTSVLAADPFMIVALPDSQYYNAPANGGTPASFSAQTQWIADHRLSSNIAFVTHLGDIVDNAGISSQWTNAVAAMNILQPPGGTSVIPYGLSPGNHDMLDGGLNFLANFGPSHFSADTWYGGSSPSHLSSFQTFSAGGYNFLHISLEVNASAMTSPTALAWAQDVIQSHPGLPTIVSVHSYLDQTTRGDNGDSLWNNFIHSTPQIFMVLNGHFGGTNQQISINDVGGNVIEMLSNYQYFANGGNGFFRELIFDPDDGLIRIRTYSPVLDQYMTDASNQFAYNVSFGVDNRITVNGLEVPMFPIWTPEPSTLSILAFGLFVLSARRQPYSRRV
jgi:hypothetical protein